MCVYVCVCIYVPKWSAMTRGVCVTDTFNEQTRVWGYRTRMLMYADGCCQMLKYAVLRCCERTRVWGYTTHTEEAVGWGLSR